MLRMSIVVIAALLVTGVVAFEDIDGSLAKLDPIDRATLIEAIDLHMNDGTSTKIRNVRPVSENVYLCGWIDSKNSFGAYVGYRRFILHMGSKEFLYDGDFHRGTEHLAASTKRFIGAKCGQGS